MTLTTRFAPSPTGPLHLGHAFSALTAFELARSVPGGRFLLRIEDIDQSRSRPAWEEQIYDDLAWLGLEWERPVLRQSDRQAAYRTALEHLWSEGLLFACHCTRRDILTAVSAPQEGAPMGPDGVIYPGTCRRNTCEVLGPDLPDAAMRLDMRKAMLRTTGGLNFKERLQGTETNQVTRSGCVDNIGDIVLARRDMGTSYHLSVVLDDAHQGVSDVVRGADLFDATAIHVVLQHLLGLPVPVYHHHRLIRDDTGKRLAKRDDARALSTLRADRASPAEIRHIVGIS